MARLKSQAEIFDQLKKSLVKIDSIEEDGRTLKKLLADSENKLSDLIRQVDSETKAAGSRQTVISENVRQLEKQLEALQAKIELYKNHNMELPDAISASKASFRIDMYPHQGHYQGKIEHLLSRTKKAFQGLDSKAMIDFISQFLPKLETADKAASGKTEPDTALADRREAETAQSPADGAVPGLKNLRVYQPGCITPSMFVFRDKVFKLSAVLKCNRMNISSADPLAYNIMIYAHSLENRTEHLLGEVDGHMSTASSSKIKLKSMIPYSGTYRLKAYASFFRPKIASAKPQFQNIYRGNLLDVH